MLLTFFRSEVREIDWRDLVSEELKGKCSVIALSGMLE
jgi:hypothetical protein